MQVKTIDVKVAFYDQKKEICPRSKTVNIKYPFSDKKSRENVKNKNNRINRTETTSNSFVNQRLFSEKFSQIENKLGIAFLFFGTV